MASKAKAKKDRFYLIVNSTIEDEYDSIKAAQSSYSEDYGDMYDDIEIVKVVAVGTLNPSTMKWS